MEQLVDVSSLIIQSVNLAVIIFVLWRFLFAPYLKHLDEEAKKRVLLDTELAKSGHIVADAHNQATNIIDQAKLDAKIVANEITENARREAAELLKKSHIDADAARAKGFEDIALERKNMVEELRSKVIDVALKMNEKLFSQNDANVEFLKNQAKTTQL